MNKIGFMNDEIFLLNREEYDRCKGNIPHIHDWWWLRGPGYTAEYAPLIFDDKMISGNGYSSIKDKHCIRPAIHKDCGELPAGTRKIYYDFPWILVDKDTWIAEVPIDFENYDSESNDYEHSEIRAFLRKWINERTDNT